MLFHDNYFLLVLLPAALIGFGLLRRIGAAEWIAPFLIGISIWFYYPQGPIAMAALLGSVVGNKLFGTLIVNAGPSTRRAWLVAGIAANLILLGYFKYTNFFLSNFTALGGPQIGPFDIILPAGISFHIFQQIAYLVDVSRKPRRYGWGEYGLFVVFFPQFVAGPIVHHREMIPQIDAIRGGALPEPWSVALASGFVIFTIGLAKKLLIADQVAPIANMIFAEAAAGKTPTLFLAWSGALAYTIQLYFDFSGYSDMAIGLARMFGLRLPQNFDAPYRAHSIIDFWRRWHITLSRFLRDYLYIPLGGNKLGESRRLINIMIVMLLGGLWHGASWNFVLWGALHGAALVVAHAWPRRVSPIIAMPLTFLFVVFAWVVFRAPDLPSAVLVWKGMLGAGGAELPEQVGRIVGMRGGEWIVFNNLPFRYLWQAAGNLGIAALIGGSIFAVAAPRQNPPAGWDMLSRMPRTLELPSAAAILTVFLLAFYLKDVNAPFLYFQF